MLAAHVQRVLRTVAMHGEGATLTLVGYSQGAAVALLLAAALRGLGAGVRVVVVRGQFEEIATHEADASRHLTSSFPKSGPT